MDKPLVPYRISTVKPTGNVFFAKISGFNAEYVVTLLVASLKHETEVLEQTVLPHDIGYITLRYVSGDKMRLKIEREQNTRKGVMA